MVADLLEPARLSLGDTLEAIGQAKTTFEVFKQLKAVGEAYRLPNFLVTTSPGDTSSHFTRRVIITNWNPELLALLVEANNWGRTRAVVELVSSKVPVTVRNSDFLGGDKDDGQSNIRAMVEHGLDRKAFFPVQVADRQRGAVSFAGTRGPVRLDEMAEMFLVAGHAFARAMELRRDEEPNTPLSIRELRILTLFAEGMTADQVADEIGVTTHTINFHSANAMRKVGARNKLHAVAIALKNGWLSTESAAA